MTVLTESIDVARPPEQAFAYISDFTTTAEWDSTAVSARKLTPGAIGVGTEFDVVCALPVGSVSILYTVIALEPDTFIELNGTSRLFNVRDRITFRPSPRGTTIDYSAEFEFNNLIKPIASLSQKGLERMGRESVESLGKALDDDFSITAASSSGNRMDIWALPSVSLFTRLGYRLGSKRFNPMSTSVKGQHMVITGATAGLGYAAAMELARRGAELTLIVRDKAKAVEAIDRIEHETGNTNVRYELADLCLLDDVDDVVNRLIKSGRPIDVLINNAGALFTQHGLTDEDLERSHALLLLSPCKLTEGLKPLLAAASAPRVINIVSGGMYSQKLDVDALISEPGGGYSGSTAYARQKRALMVMTEEWAKQWAEQGIVVNAMHPGWADTPGVRGSLPTFYKVTRRILRSCEEGADTIIWLAVAREAGAFSGKLFLDRKAQSTHLLRTTIESREERQKLIGLVGQFCGS